MTAKRRDEEERRGNERTREKNGLIVGKRIRQ